MSAKSNHIKTGAALLIFCLTISMIVSPVLAEDETEPVMPTVSFVQEGEPVFGPPLPSYISFVLSIKDMVDEYVDLKIQVISLATEEGQSLNIDSIQAFPCENAEKKVQTDIKDQVLTREICLNPENVEWGTYTAVIQASLGDLAYATKSIKLIAGPETPVSILNSNIIVLGTICPRIARADAVRALLCPTFDEDDAKTIGGTNIITITGYPEKEPERFTKYFQNASGTLVSTDGAGRILVRLNDEVGFKTCRYKTDGMICSEAPLAFWGSLAAGNYSGIFYLDPKDRTNEAIQVEITFKAKDYWILPALVILLGLAVSAWITWRLGPQKEKNVRDKADKIIREKRNYLKASLDEFRELKEAKDAYFVKDPDILTEVEFLLLASDDDTKNDLTTIGLSDLEKQMTCIVPLFVRFWSFYLTLYDLHIWEATHRNKLGNVKNLGEEIENARQEIWTADSDEAMDSAQDLLTKALLTAHDAHRNYEGRPKPKAPPLLKVIQPSIKEEKLAPPNEQSQREGFQIEFKPEKFAQWLIVLLSGIYVVYVTNQTFGTPQDYIYAFLWGSATNAGIDFASNFFSGNGPVMSRFELTK